MDLYIKIMNSVKFLMKGIMDWLWKWGYEIDEEIGVKAFTTYLNVSKFILP